MNPLSASVLLNRLLSKGRLRHIQVLVKLMELGSAKRTAEALNISQPAVTQLLADLEALTEIQLFERHVRGVRPTAAGTALAPLARRLLDTVAEGSETLSAMKNASKGVVRLAAITGVISGLLTRALPLFAAAHPGIQLHVMEADVDAWAKQVAQNEVDLVGCRRPAVIPHGWEFKPLLEDRFVVVCGPRHPLARRRRVKLASLRNESWLPAPLPSAARREFDRFAQNSPTPINSCQVITRVSSLTSAMLRQARLVSIVPFSVARQLVEDGQLVAVDIEGEAAFEPLGLLVLQREQSLSAKTVADFLENFAASNP